MTTPSQIAEIQVRYSSPLTEGNRTRIACSMDAYGALLTHWDKDTLDLQETFNLLLLNRANEVLGIYQLSKGGMSGTVVDAKLIFAVALKCLAVGIILAHNHPSGNLAPSIADLELTQKLKKAGELLDIMVLDHLIITREGYYSFADEGRV